MIYFVLNYTFSQFYMKKDKTVRNKKDEQVRDKSIKLMLVINRNVCYIVTLEASNVRMYNF